VTRECGQFGAQIGPAEDQIRLAVQAYADDVILISNDPNGVAEMLKVLEDFVDWSKMEVNVKKCATASYLRDMNRHRCSSARSLNLKGATNPKPDPHSITEVPRNSSCTKKNSEVGSSRSKDYRNENSFEENHGVTFTNSTKN
jgi:hypothetical protein